MFKVNDKNHDDVDEVVLVFLLLTFKYILRVLLVFLLLNLRNSILDGYTIILSFCSTFRLIRATEM